MLLKNLMEDKKLNFNQPLLSVRRFSSTVTSGKDVKRKTDNALPNIPPLPSYKSELKSGPVRNPGVVPFVWEQSPGRPKDESKTQARPIERPPMVPKLPPGRTLKAKQRDSDEVSEDASVIKHQAAGKVSYLVQSISSLDEHVTKLGSSKDMMEEKESSDSGDGDDIYLDALDTLSRTESFFLNCSVTGLSGLDGPDVQPSGTFLSDPQTRDFMMGRFLPAAKAMTSETPQYASKKQSTVWEQPRQMKKIISGNKLPQLRYVTNNVPHYDHDIDDEESEDDYDDQAKLSGKVCGLLPRFSLLNPVLGMSVRTRISMSPVSRTQPRSSSSDSCSGNEEHTRVAIYEKRSVNGLQTPVPQGDKSIMTDESNQIAYQRNFHQLEGSSLYRRLQGSVLSPHSDELPKSPFFEHGFLGISGETYDAGVSGLSSHKKCNDSFLELLADRCSNGETDAASHMVEKTLYVDTVHKVKSPKADLRSPEMKGLPNLIENDFEILVNSKGREADSSLKDIGGLAIADEQTALHPNYQKSSNFNILSSAGKPNHGVLMDKVKDFTPDHLCQNSTALQNSKVPGNVNLDFEVQQPQNTNIFGNSHGSSLEFPVPPPLLKSPSDSWLWRTLPSMKSKNLSSQSYFGTVINLNNQASKRSSADPKWEAIVKTTKVQHQYVQFSEELMDPIPENQ